MLNNPRVRENLRKSGKPGNKGGGRPKNKTKQWFIALANNPKVKKFVKDLVTGEAIEEKVLDDPVDGKPMKILVAAPAKVRVDMIKEIWNRGHGKITLPIEVGVTKDLADRLAQARHKCNGSK